MKTRFFLTFCLIGLSLKAETNKPNVKIDVNKTYDSQGDLVSYDSTYSYSYTYEDSSSLGDPKVFLNDFNSFFEDSWDSPLPNISTMHTFFKKQDSLFLNFLKSWSKDHANHSYR